MGIGHSLYLKKGFLAIILLYLLAGTGQLLAKNETKIQDIVEAINSKGSCKMSDGSVAPDISTRAILTHSDGGWAMAMETIGSNSAGSWFINFTKNGVGEPSMLESFNPPGGWSVVGNHIDKGAAKGRYVLNAKATKYAVPIIVCEVTIAMQDK